MKIFLVFALFFAFLDRLSGGWPQVPGRGQYYAPLFIPVAMLLGLSWEVGLAISLAFMLWRMPAWRLFGGSLAPYPEEYAGTYMRHALGSGAIMAAWFVTGNTHITIQMAAVMLLFPLLALQLAIMNRREADKGKDINAAVELVRGAIFGAIASLPYI